MSGPRFEWRGAFVNAEVNGLHADGFDHAPFEDDRRGRVERWSLGRVTARDGGRLVGFVDVAWDGRLHAFLLDTVVAADLRRSGIGAALVDACGFRPTDAGLIALR